MRGRDKFRKFRPIIMLISRVIGLFPASFRFRYFVSLRNKNGTAAMVLRYAALKTLAESVGDNVSVHPGVYILNPQKLKIGSNVSFHPMCYVEARGGITIGSDVSIAHGVTILSETHNFEDTQKKINDQGLRMCPSKIGDNVWIGAKATILGGVTVGDGAVVGAGSVVTRDVPENAVSVGVPAKMIKTRGE